MAKIFVCIAIVVVSTFIGKSFSDKHSKQYSFYCALKSFNLSLKRNIKFKRQNLIELLDFKSSDEDFNCYLSSCKLTLVSNENIDRFFPFWCSDNDKDFLVAYMEGVGKNGRESELDFINSQEEIIDERIAKIEENMKKYSSLGQKLGFALGMGLVVIII